MNLTPLLGLGGCCMLHASYCLHQRYITCHRTSKKLAVESLEYTRSFIIHEDPLLKLSADFLDLIQEN